jgi:hypothetical protein
MAYDEDLALRIRAAIGDLTEVTEMRMFGGLAFLVGGHMAVAASGQGGLLLRVDPATDSDLLDDPHVNRMKMRGREMPGWLRVTDDAIASDADLSAWVARGLTYARSLPPK